MKLKIIGGALAILVIATGGWFTIQHQVAQQRLNKITDFAGREQAGNVRAVATSTKKAVTIPNTPNNNNNSLNCPSTEPARFSCYEKYYQQLVDTVDVKGAMADLRVKYNQDPYVKAQCHQIAHVIGRAATGKYPSVDEAYIRGDSECWSGYYHGVIEALMRKIGRDNITFSVLNNICAPLRTKSPYSFDHYNCVHGVGHGIMYINDNELFTSLNVCNGVSDDWEKRSCWSGVFMENIIADGKDHVTKYLKPEDPLYPCDAVNEDQKMTCYLMQTSYMLKLKNNDFKAVFNLCQQTGPKYDYICYQSLGRDASGRTSSDAEQTKNYCLLGTDQNQQSNCVIGAVKDFVSYYHSDVQAKTFCAILPSNLNGICTQTMVDYYKSLKI